MFRWFFVLVMLCLLLLTLPAWGGEEERAYSLFEEGVRAYERGDLRTAWTRFREALEIFWRLGLEGEAAFVLHNLGVVARGLAQYEEAKQYLQEALRVFQKFGLEREAADALNNLGVVASDLAQYEEAKRYLQEALEVYERLGLEGEAARALNNLADALLEENRFEEAWAILKERGANIPLGKYYLKRGDSRSAREYFRRSLSFGRETKALSLQVPALIGLGLCAEAEGSWGEAEGYYREAVLLLEAVREGLPEKDRRDFLSGKEWGFPRLFAYEGLVRSLLKQKKLEEAFLYSEHTKARFFLDLLARAPVSSSFGLPEEIRQRERTLIQTLATLRKEEEEAFKRGDPALLATLRERLSALRREEEEFIAFLRRNYPEYASLRYPEPLPASSLTLRKGEVLLAYEVTDTATFLFLVEEGRVTALHTIPLSRKDLEGKVREYRKAFEGVAQARDPLAHLRTLNLPLGKELFDLLLGPVLPSLEGKKVLVVPDEFLALLPLEALVLSLPQTITWQGRYPFPEGVRFLGEARTFTYWQSGTSLTVVRRLGGRNPSRQQVLSVVDPVFNRSDRRVQSGEVRVALRGREVELAEERNENILQFFGFDFLPPLPASGEMVTTLKRFGFAVTALTGTQASEARLKSLDLTPFGYILFATHGILDTRTPYLLQPAIVLSNPIFTGEEEDGFLTASEVMELSLQADCVATMACVTGVGKVVGGEGVMHLGRAFQYAGARSVLISLWGVEDESTNLLTQAFFQFLREGRGKDEALYLARRKLREAGYRHPFFWASFILFGER